jgi:toxin ParE1/3/4
LKQKSVVPRQRAHLDAEEAVDRYAVEAGIEVALKFIGALQRAYEHLGRHPLLGSPRFGFELSWPGLRTWPVRGFPFLVFYVDLPDRVDVWRVLDARRDIPAWMQEPDSAEVRR